MEKIVIYCKSFLGDIERVKKLRESIDKYNMDRIPVIISVPGSDVSRFRRVIGRDGYTLIKDEDITRRSYEQNWNTAHIVKCQFWRLGLSENILVIDSDAQFIRNFYIRDFMYNDEIPYTVMHECKDYMQFIARTNFPDKENFTRIRKTIMEVFGRAGKYYDFGPNPTIWSTAVWRSFEKDFLIPQNLTFEDIINKVNDDNTWYGEFLLRSKVIDLMPAEPLFKVFHRKEQYEESKRLQIRQEEIAQNFLGIILNSNWLSPLKY